MAQLIWSLDFFCEMLCDRLLNKFDVFLIIEGKRGTGKSTLGWKILKKVRAKMKKRGIDGYKWSPKRDIIYQRKKAISFFNKWKHSALLDEMINVSFNRDFYQEEQKDFIKIINMNRDHNNLCIACVPQFKTLDSQIKNLTAIRIQVERRGIAIIHMPNRTIYSADVWDEKLNEKIEREWNQGGVHKPRYSKLTTFKGYLRFKALSEKEEELYQKIKNEQRTIIAKEKNLDEVEPDTPVAKIGTLLINGSIRNFDVLEGMLLQVHDNPKMSKDKLRNWLKAEGRPSRLKDYFMDKTIAGKERKKSEISGIIHEVMSRKAQSLS